MTKATFFELGVLLQQYPTVIPLMKGYARNVWVFFKDFWHFLTILFISLISIILKLYSPRYPVNITFQGAAAQLSHIFRVLFIMF